MTDVVLIPAYEPDERLIEIVKKIRNYNFNNEKLEMVVVDDGSGEKYNKIFSSISKFAKVISYDENKGKGYALKQGINYINDTYKNGYNIVTMDSDGQHTVSDAVKILKASQDNPDSLILGKRIRDKSTPLRSRIGNSFSKLFFKLTTGINIYDTQTGLRAFSSRIVNSLLKVAGDRYDYEMNVLFNCSNLNIPIKEVEIETIYIDKNSKSHFNALKDSYLIYKEVIKFLISSLISFVIDYSLFGVFFSMFGIVTVSNVLARIISACCNFSMNKFIVFKSKKKTYQSAVEYFALAVTILAINTMILNLFINVFEFNALISKVTVEIILFITSWLVQKRFVFKKL